MRYADDGTVRPVPVPPLREVARTGWRVGRSVRSEGPAEVRHTAEDTPFYARSMIRGRIGEETVQMMHESLDLDRFASRWVQTLLPFRMPRRP
jgi:carotenoid 1,2-hydratase